MHPISSHPTYSAGNFIITGAYTSRIFHDIWGQELTTGPVCMRFAQGRREGRMHGHGDGRTCTIEEGGMVFGKCISKMGRVYWYLWGVKFHISPLRYESRWMMCNNMVLLWSDCDVNRIDSHRIIGFTMTSELVTLLIKFVWLYIWMMMCNNMAIWCVNI
jgi:hypothetical protein